MQSVMSESDLLSKPEQLSAFRSMIWHFYADHRRSFSWRENITPYRVVVSEIMLQQTQTERVAKKFELFVEAFPDFLSLAQAPFVDVLRLWKGLGYNRRALYLKKIAERIITDYDGILPRDIAVLQSFAGIGKATARSIFSFAYDAPSIFIETNIRTVYLYFFFKDIDEPIPDRVIEILLSATMNNEHPRDWYYALMDFGAMLKKMVGNQNYKSAHYKKQSKFIGSDRQLRGQILQVLLEQSLLSRHDLMNHFVGEEERILSIIADLSNEGLIKETEYGFCL